MTDLDFDKELKVCEAAQKKSWGTTGKAAH